MATVTSYVTPIPSVSCSNQMKPAIFSYSTSASILCPPRNPKSLLFASIPRRGLGLISHWNGLKHLGISRNNICGQKVRKAKCRGMVVYASLFGVGAPEALVIGVVALLVFGPKGLAEVARNLGKTLRAFQPTIRELQEVSREFKTTLEREIGLDDIPPSASDTTNSKPSSVNENPQGKVDPNGTSTNTSYPGEDSVKVTQEQVTSPGSTEQQTGPLASEEKPQDGTSPTKTAEDFAKVTQEQITTSTAPGQQTGPAASDEKPQDGTSPTRDAYSSEELLRVTEEQLIAAAAAKEQTSPEKQPQVATLENDSSAPLSQKLEGER